MKLSETLKIELLRRRARGERQYEIAARARLHPTSLSAMLHGAVPIAENDPRVIRLATVLAMPPADCFSKEPG